MLFQIQHDNKSKLWCGPAAIAAVTGQPTSVITQLIREVGGRTRIQGTYNTELIRTMSRLGYRLEKALVGNGKTLAQWARENRYRFAELPAIVNVTEHYVVLHGRRLVDNHTKDPVWISSAPHLRKKVVSAWVFKKVGDPQLPAPRHVDRTSSNAMAKAKRLAAKHGIEIERENFGDRNTWWVTCPALEHDDPHEGSHGAYSQHEVLQAVEDYVKCLTGGYLEAVTEPPAPPEPVCPDTTAAAVEFVLHRDGASTPMDVACELSLRYSRGITERQVRGAAIHLIRSGRVRWLRKKLTPVAQAGA